MNLRFVRRMAADVLGVGENAIWFDPDRSGEISTAITRDDVRRLVREGKIRVRPENTKSKGRQRYRSSQKSKGRRKGVGKRKGPKGARTPRKRAWASRIRTIRSRLAEMRENREIDRSAYRKLYRMAKAGYFRSTAHLETYVEEKELGAS